MENTFFSHIPFKIYLGLLSSDVIVSSFRQVLESSQRNTIFSAEVVWFVFMTLFRAWWASGITVLYFPRRIWLSIWTFAVYAVVAVYVIPGYFLGTAYTENLKKKAEVLYQSSEKEFNKGH